MEHIAIVGLGIIGGSFAKAIQSQFPTKYHVSAIDIKQTTLDEAIDLGVIAEGETTNQTILQRADLVIIALYPTLVRQFMLDHRDDFKYGAIVTEATGVKQSIMADILPGVPEHIEFIFGHPMAGRESQGFAYSDDRVFLHANYILTPHDGNTPEALERFSAFIRGLGFGRLTIASPKLHDEMIAYTSQLTHLIAAALINSDQPGHNTVEFIGDSFRELTRIAKMNESLWSELILNNQQALLTVFEAFEDKLAKLKEAIVAGDKSALEKEFIESTKRRLSLEAMDQANQYKKERGK